MVFNTCSYTTVHIRGIPLHLGPSHRPNAYMPSREHALKNKDDIGIQPAALANVNTVAHPCVNLIYRIFALKALETSCLVHSMGTSLS